MAEVFRYEVIPTASWAYLSTILMVSIYFKFNRFISVRNLDILMLSLLAPGLLIVQHGQQKRQQLEPEIRDCAAAVQGLQVGQDRSAGDGSVKVDSVGREDELSQNSSAANVQPESDFSTAKNEKTNALSDSPNLERAKQRLAARTTELETIKGFQRWGYVWLFVAGGALLIRMLIDPFMIRRPMLEPNLEFSGLTFLTIVLLIFLIANIIAASPAKEDINAAESGKNLATAKATDPTRSKGPGYSLLFLFPVIPTFVTDEDGGMPTNRRQNTTNGNAVSATVKNPKPQLPVDGQLQISQEDELSTGEGLAANVDSSLIVVSKIMAIIGQLSIVIGIYMIGYLHFGNTRTGIGIVTLYLLLPYTAEMTGRIIHILPAAAMVWALVCYRKPFWSGSFVGLAMGLAYYPIFLLPLWISFYWHRGLRQFLIGFLVMVGILAVTLVFTSSDLQHFWQNLRAMFGIWAPLMEGLRGFWEEGNLDTSYRLPIMAAFFCLSISFAAWPAQKDLGTLLSCSAALMLAVQFWNGFGGGLLMAWYLPVALMTIFRPNLEDRTAVALLLKT